MLKLVEGRPEDVSGRLEKEIQVYDLLDSLNVAYQRIDHEAAMTMDACEEIDRTLGEGVEKVQLLIDKDVLEGEFFACHPCINTSSLRFRTKDLMEKVIPAMEHEPKMVEL